MNFNTILFAVLTVTASVTNALNPCKNQENGKMLPYKDNPYNYLLCENNDAILMICEDGEKFNIKKGECSKKEHLETNVTINESEINEKLKKYCGHLSNGIKLPYSKNCEEYYICYNNIAHLKRCESSLYYNSRKAACVRKEEAECNINSITEVICKDMADGTMLPHPTDCNKFYICVHDDSVEKFCPVGLHFSPKISVCTYPEDAGCETDHLCKDKPNGELISNIRNCSKYYLCFHDEAKSKECGNGLHFSPSKKYCMLPELAGCEKNLTTTENPITQTTPITTTKTTPITTTKTTIITTTSSPPPVDICKNQSSIVTVPHPTDCSKFYICVYEDPVEKICPHGQHFSATELVCTNPEDAGCEGLELCKNTTMNGEQIPNPRNCSTFYICFHDEAKRKHCPDDLHFSPTKRICMLPELAGCDPNHITTTTPRPTKPPPPNDICKGENDGQVFPYPYDCEKFYVCSNEEAKLKSCAKDLHFSPTMKYCMNPELAGCEVIITTTADPATTTETPDDICKSEKDGQVFPYPYDCGKFYICSDEKANIETCSPGLHFSPTEKYCMPPHLAGCDPNEMCKNQTDGTMYPYPEDCEKFWVCSDHVANLKTCGKNLHFSPTKLYCMIPELAGCDPHHNSTTTPKPTESPNYICKNQENGETFPYPYDCEKFYICMVEEAKLKSCAIGLHYSSKHKYCMLPELAGCDPNHSTSTSEGTPTVTNEPPTNPPITPTDDPITKPPITTTEKPNPESCKGQPLGSNIKHPKDCTKYIVCIGGGVVRDCPHPLEFSVELKVCDWPERANCKITADHNIKKKSLPTKPIRKIQPTKKKQLITTAESCKGIQFGKTVKHPSDCTKYIVCIDKGIEQNCPAPLEFNEALAVCDWPERANCKN